MNLERAISYLVSANSSEKPTLQQLGDVIGVIVQTATNTKSGSSSTVNINQLFEQLTKIVRSGQSSIFRELVEAEKQTRKENEPTLLMTAVMAGKTEVVQELIAAGVDINIRIKEFFIFDAMYFAVDKEHLDIVKILIAAGADLNWSDPGLSPLLKAIKKQNIELLQLLLDAGAKVEFKTGFNPLVYAAGQVDNPEIIRLLLEAGCNANSTNSMGDTALVDACLHGHEAVIKLLLASGADANKPRKDKLAPLIAVFSVPQINQSMSRWGIEGDVNNLSARMVTIIRALADSGANLNIRGSLGKTALMLAAEGGYFDIAQVLIEKGTDVNAVEDFSQALIPDLFKGMEEALEERSERKTALLYAAENGNTEIVNALLAAGADFSIADKKNRTALDVAIQQGHTAIVRLLENAGAQVLNSATHFSEAALLGAAKQGNLEILRSALQAGINPNTKELEERRNTRHKTALMFAAERGHLEAVRILLEAGADVNLSDRPGKKLGKTPLMYGAESGHAEIIRLLLESGATVDAQNKRGETALLYAVWEKKVEAVRVLLEFGADPHKKSWDDTPFVNATYAGREIAQLITEASKHKSSAVGNAAQEEMLRSASFSGNFELVRDLIRQGTNINAPEQESGWTAFIYAAAKGSLDIVQILLAAGADVNAASYSGQTALSEAAYWGHLEIVNLLICVGADVNLHEIDDTTPLMKALMFGFGSFDIVKALLDAGADPNIRNNGGQTALDIALEKNNTAVAQILRQAGATE